MHVSQYIELYLFKSIFIFDDDKHVESCILELFYNNQEAVQKFINEDVIKNLIRIMH